MVERLNAMCAPYLKDSSRYQATVVPRWRKFHRVRRVDAQVDVHAVVTEIAPKRAYKQMC